jgi:hypothetical protein
VSKKLKEIFKEVVSEEALQEAADAILPDLALPAERLSWLKKIIAGEVNPTFDQSNAILAWDKKQRAAVRVAEKAVSGSDIPSSKTVTTSAVMPRRPTSGMTW